MAGIGLRRGDIDRLEVGDVDLHGKTIRIKEKKTGKASVRPLPDALIQPLADHIAEIPEGQRQLLRPPYQRTKWLKIVEKAKINPKPTPHDLRRSYATLQALAGTPMHVVQRLLAHSNIETTIASYIAAGDEETRKASNMLNIDSWIT